MQKDIVRGAERAGTSGRDLPRNSREKKQRAPERGALSATEETQKLKRAPTVTTRAARAAVSWPKLALAMLLEMLVGLKFKLLNTL